MQGVGLEDEMPDLLHWSAALLALLGLFLWFWSGGIRVPQSAESAQYVARRKRQLGRVAIFAAVVSALLQAAVASASTTQLKEIVLWASATPAAIVSTDAGV
jgi:hypothetical protein